MSTLKARALAAHEKACAAAALARRKEEQERIDRCRLQLGGILRRLGFLPGSACIPAVCLVPGRYSEKIPFVVVEDVGFAYEERGTEGLSVYVPCAKCGKGWARLGVFEQCHQTWPQWQALEILGASLARETERQPRCADCLEGEEE